MTGPTACRQGPMVRIHLPPAASQERTGTPAGVSAPSREPLVGFGRLAARSAGVIELGGSPGTPRAPQIRDSMIRVHAGGSECEVKPGFLILRSAYLRPPPRKPPPKPACAKPKRPNPGRKKAPRKPQFQQPPNPTETRHPHPHGAPHPHGEPEAQKYGEYPLPD